MTKRKGKHKRGERRSTEEEEVNSAKKANVDALAFADENDDEESDAPLKEVLEQPEQEPSLK